MRVASVRKVVDQYGVYISGHCYGRFGALLDANCFALQLLERGVAEEIRLLSGVIVPK